MMRLMLPLLAVVLLAGCSLLEPKPDRTRYFLLSSVAQGSSTKAASPELAVGVGPLRMPDYLRRAEFVRRSDDNQLRIDASERWGEPLDQSFHRVLTQNLATRLGTTSVTRVPGPVNLKSTLEVPIEVISFECDPAGTIQLQARWAIKTPHGAKYLVGRESLVSESAGSKDTTAIVAAMSRAVDHLAAEIAGAILEQDSKGMVPRDANRPKEPRQK